MSIGCTFLLNIKYKDITDHQSAYFHSRPILLIHGKVVIQEMNACEITIRVIECCRYYTYIDLHTLILYAWNDKTNYDTGHICICAVILHTP